MRPPADDWCDFRATVPLTGREPVLGSLRSRLAGDLTAFGWVTVCGPGGSGVSRLLDEARALLVAEGLPRPLRLWPAPPGSAPLEAVRRALTGPLGPAARTALLRSLAFLTFGVPGGDRALLWLAAGPGVADPPPPSASVLRHLLRFASAGVPLLVDDLQEMDPATRQVLEAEEGGAPLSVLAGSSGADSASKPGLRLALQPLTEAQVHLLLKRWLRPSDLAKRLAPEAFAVSGGWPGRVVRFVQGLAVDGALAGTPRGALRGGRPADPRTRLEPLTFLRWATSRGASTRRLLEAAAVHGAPLDAELLARSCGVKRAVAADFLLQAEAAGADRSADWLFPEPGSREALLLAMGGSRRADRADALAAAWRERPAGPGEGIQHARQRLRAVLRATPSTGALPEALALVERLRAAGSRDPAALSLLAEVLRRAPPGADAASLRTLAFAVVDSLTEAGRPDEAFRVLRLPSTRRVADRRDRGAAWRLARLGRLAGRGTAALRRLERAFAMRPADGIPAAEAFEAAAERARVLAAGDAGAPQAVRAAWSEALRHLPRHDLGRRRILHAGLADLAEQDGRPRAAIGHLRRGAALARAQGDPAAAAQDDLRRGRLLARRGDLPAAVHALGLALRGFLTLGDARRAAEARLEAGCACAGLHAFDEAVAYLEAASDTLRDAPVADAGRWHLALARAYEGRGDLAAARRLATLARGAGDAGDRIRLEADLVLSRTAARAGDLGVTGDLARCERALRSAGFPGEAASAAQARTDALLRAGDGASAASSGPLAGSPEEHLLAARVRMLCGDKVGGRRGFEAVARDPRAPVHLRAEAYARLACALLRVREPEEARPAAAAAASLLEVRRRSRAEDARVHRMLAAAFSALGERTRAGFHRTEARRLASRLRRAVPSPLRDVGRRSPRLLDPARARHVA